jgi:hypothetical protein
LIEVINRKGIYYLSQAKAMSRVGHITSNWISSEDLELTGCLRVEWKAYRVALINNGIILQDKSDQLKWTGGNKYGQVTVRNIYLVVESHKWIYKSGGWHKAMWDWDCSLKIKLFFWLMMENKILSWETLQRRGFIGPSVCKLCMKSTKSTQHLFLECAFTQEVRREKLSSGGRTLIHWEKVIEE